MSQIQPEEAVVGATPQAEQVTKFQTGDEVRILAHPFDEHDPELGTLGTVADPDAGDEYGRHSRGSFAVEVRFCNGEIAYYGEDELEVAA